MQSDFRKKFWALLIVGVLCVVSTTLWAADIVAKIRGTVTDPTGAVVAHADITATNVGTGQAYKASSGSSGDYEITRLPIGTYNVTVVAPGFQKFSAKGVTLNIDQAYVLPVGLKVGAATETVEVSASAVQVDTTNIQLGNVVNNQQIVDLPLNGRNFTTLQLLLPGVQGASDRFGSNVTGGAFSANGSQTQQSSFLIMGTDANDLPLNTPIVIPSVDAIAQFQFATNSLNPEYGRNSGAVVNATIKNGTNSFHGSAFDFYRDTFLNARNFFQRPTATSNGVPVFHQNQFGGTIGGPIYKDKAFFFFSFQGIRARQPQASQNPNVYTAPQRTGDFSNYTAASFSLNPIPGTIGAVLGPLNAACAAGLTWRNCFTATGRLVPGGVAGMNPTAVTLMNTFVPLPNSGTQFTWTPVQKVPWTRQFIGRVDVNLSSKDQMWGVLVFNHAPTIEDLAFTAATLPGFGSTAGRETKQFTVSWTHTFSPTTLNELRVGYTRFNFAAVLPQTVVQPSSVGFAINPQAPDVAGLPRIQLTGFFALGFSSNGPQPRLDQTRQAVDNFTKIMGKHSLKFGIDVRRFNVDNPFFAQNNGSYGFSGDAVNTDFSTGHADVDFLLGNPSSYGQNSGARIDAYAWETYVYGQDVWKARNNLTFTLGFGWQVDTAMHNRQFDGHAAGCFIPGQQSVIFPNNFSGGGTLGPPAGLNYPGDPGCNDAQGAVTQWKNVGPRFGFAYSPNLGRISAGSSGKFVIRGGVGVYFNRTEEETILQNLAFPPYGLGSAGAADFAGTASFTNPFRDIDTGFVNPNKFPAVFASAGQLIDFTIFEPFVQSQVAPDFKIPYAVNYNLTVQRELPANIVLTLSYVGSLGRRLQTTVEANPITRAGHDACLLNPLDELGLGIRCLSSTGRRLQSLLFPSHTKFGNGDIFSSMAFINSRGTSSYNSLQISATKGLSHGLIFQASYTYSHSLDDSSGFEDGGFGNATGYNQFAPSRSYGNSAFDARHRFVFSPVYEIPNWKKLRGLDWMPDVIGKGWKISGILTLASGFPFDISYFGGSSRSLFCPHSLFYYTCPDSPVQVGPLALANPRNSIGGNNCWFTGGAATSTRCGTGAAFVDETLGSFGNMGRYKFHGPGLNNMDMSLAKDIYFWPGHESRYLELRFEMFNALNHTQFNLPNGTFTSSSFGRITGAAPARLIQLGAKFYF